MNHLTDKKNPAVVSDAAKSTSPSEFERLRELLDEFFAETGL